MLHPHIEIARVRRAHAGRHLLMTTPIVQPHQVLATVQAVSYTHLELVDGIYPLDQVNAAMADAAARRVLRAAIVP